jgi:hypothetical protein
MRKWLVGAGVALGTLSGTTVAWAQLTPDPTATPTRPPNNFVNWMAYGMLLLGVLLAVALIAAYLRYSSRFFGSREEAGPKIGAPAPPVITVGQYSRTQPQALAASMARPPLPVEQTPVGAAASARQSAGTAPPEPPAAPRAPARPPGGSTEAAAAAETPESAKPEAVATAAPEARPEAEAARAAETEPAVPASEPAAAASEPAAATKPASAPGGSTLDQETYDRVLEEQLGKGVDRRVAEGKARSAAVRAARAKAEG